MFSVLGYISLVFGTMYFNKFLKDREVRTLLLYACYLSCISSFLSLLFALRLNLVVGISDLVFTAFTDIVLGTLGLAYT